MKKGLLMRLRAILLVVAILLSMSLVGCGGGKEKVLIYTSVEDYVIEDMNK